MSEEEEPGLSGPMTVIALVNGMIGGLILILPVMALESGWLLTLIVLLVTGFISYYSCYLCVLHTGDATDMDVAMEQHFWNSKKVKMFYEFCIFSTIIVILILYYELIVIQWEGLACNNEYTPLNPIINAFALLAMVFVIKFKDFGATLMAYGIVSIVTYLFFITWAVGSEDSDHDHEKLRLFHGDGIDLAAALGQAFAIQAFFIPVLKQNRKPHKYKLYTLMAFVLGTLAYGYIAFMGSQGIVHRQFLGDESESRTIEGYFEAGAWQVKVIEVIYLVHLYSVFPEFLLISKKRVFSIFNLQESEHLGINRSQIAYIFLIIVFCLCMALLKISLRVLVQFNGAVIGFFFIYFFPVALHFKCVYMKHSHPQKDQNLQQKKDEKYVQMIEEGQNKDCDKISDGVEVECANSDDKQNYKTLSKKTTQSQGQDKTSTDTATGSSKQTICWALKKQRTKNKRRVELFILAFMLLLGMVIMIKGIVEMITGDKQD